MHISLFVVLVFIAFVLFVIAALLRSGTIGRFTNLHLIAAGLALWSLAVFLSSAGIAS